MTQSIPMSTNKNHIDILDLSRINGVFAAVSVDFLMRIKQEIKRKKSVTKFADEIGVSQSSLSQALNGSKLLTINKWMEICHQLSIQTEELKTSIEGVRLKAGSSIKSGKFPIEFSAELASLIGHAFGDAHISSSGFEYTNKSEELRRYVISTVDNLFGKQSYFTRNDPKAFCLVYNRLIGDILIMAGAIRGNKIIQSFNIPKWIINGDLEKKKAFIKAIFDDEATVNVEKYEIKFKLAKNTKNMSSLKNFMVQISRILEDLGVRTTSIKKDNEAYGKNGHTMQLRISIHGYENFVQYLNFIGFKDNKKMSKLLNLVNGYKRIKLRSGVGYKTLKKGLREENTIKDLMEKTNMSYWSVYKNLKLLQKRGFVEKIEYSRTKPAIWRRAND